MHCMYLLLMFKVMGRLCVCMVSGGEIGGVYLLMCVYGLWFVCEPGSDAC